MEGKKSAAVLAASLLIVLLLLSGQPPQVSGQARRVDVPDPDPGCFDKCYSSCREKDHKSKFVCRVRCSFFGCGGLGHRESEEVVAAASAFAGEGSVASVGSGAAATTGGGNGPAGADVAACVHGCTGHDNGSVKAKRV